ncbi:neuronal acetylcholine receptor subunit alpha-10-like [Xenia sp. Carnegie-2017]|uniref:neuronal acetylcholine receptor subunit alpha-10-like n=1 Tax=Xenia sp. Carnegie-2017 TaxID=2897299 RepID=UPI001F03FE13|nr:neuronal acetylcholine receptor subunit alpha-10-like [Xenia sp. Carnegie-2017]
MIFKCCVLLLLVAKNYAEVQGKKNNISLLMSHLVKTSSPSVLPVNESNKTTGRPLPLKMKIGVTLYQIINVDNKNQIVTLALFMRQKWKNELLHWDESKYGGLKEINIGKNKLWVPDIYIYNHAEGGSKSALDQWKTPVTIKSDGTCSWLAPGVVKTSCKLNIQYFPFDEQECKIKFGSWTYNGEQLDLHHDHENGMGDTTKFLKSGEWDLSEFSVQRNLEKYACCPELYPDVTFTLLIKRRTRYYYINMLLPNMFITVLTLVAFLLPPDCGERISLIITNFLAMVVFLLLVAEILPPNSEVTPMISIYCAGLMCEVGLALVASCFVLRLYCRQSGFHGMPSWIKTVVLNWLAKVTFATSDVAKAKKDFEEKAAKFLDLFKSTSIRNGNSKSSDVETISLLSSEWDSTYDLDQSFIEESVFTNVTKDGEKVVGEPWSSHKLYSGGSLKKTVSPSTPSTSTTSPQMIVQENKNCICRTLVDTLEERQKTLVEHVSNMSSMLTDWEINAEKKKEWHLASRILDRSFLVFFIVGLIVSSLAIFLQIP